MDGIRQKVNQHVDIILKEYKNVAVVGLSQNASKASNGVAAYLKAVGYNIIPVNPNHDTIMGLKCYASLEDVPEAIDIVDIFRRAEDVPPVVEAAIAVKAKAIWMQSGIINEQAAQKALDAGLQVVMDLCMKVEHLRHSFGFKG